MSFATSAQKWIPTRRELANAIAEALVARGLPLEWGGTGVIAAGADDAAKANDVLDTWGMTASGLIVPTRLPVLVGATSGAAGTKGAAPAGAAGDQRRPLRADATYLNELELAFVTKADGTKILDFEALGDCDNRLYTVATASGGHRARLGARGTTDTWSDLQLEPNSMGEVSSFGDLLQTTMRGIRSIVNVPKTATFTAHGAPAPTLVSPGAAAAELTDTNGTYVSLTYDFDTAAPASFGTANFLRRGQAYTVTLCFRSAFVQSLFWCGLFSANPGASPTLGSIKGVGIRMDAATDANTLQLVTSDGSTQGVTSMGVQPDANAIQCYRFRHKGGGVWMAAKYDFATLAWVGFTESGSSPVPGTSDDLGVWFALGNTSTSNIDRAISPMAVSIV